MLDSNFLSFHHARTFLRDGGDIESVTEIVPPSIPTVGLSVALPDVHSVFQAQFDEPQNYLLITSIGSHQSVGVLYVANKGVSGLTHVGSGCSSIGSTFAEHYLQGAINANSPCLAFYPADRSSAQKWAVKIAKPTPALKASVVTKFNLLATEWRNTRDDFGSVLDICSHFAYQRIIGMGRDAIPLILRELERETDHWFWALGAISGENPISENHRGKLNLMAKDWFRWARDQGFQW